jgi:acylphosphatase
MENRKARPGPDSAAFTARVSGRVQGVGFRWNAVDRAEQLGISGWVRNEDDGSVSCLCEGAKPVLERYLEWLRRGPPGAYVAGVDVHWLEYSGLYRGFTVEF